MTKREICERLMSIHNSVMFASNGSGVIGGNPCYDVDNAIRELILDIVAREEEKSPLAMKWVAVDKSAPRKPCPKCGAPSPKRIDAPGYYCEACGAGFEAEEKHPGVLAKPGKDGAIEWCWCRKCYGAADVVHDPFGDGEDWSYCRKCGVSFRLKCGEADNA